MIKKRKEKKCEGEKRREEERRRGTERKTMSRLTNST
jgi:hypothetical protein